MIKSQAAIYCWDNNGVNYIESSTQVKMGVKNTPLTRYPYPYINPTVNRGREYNIIQNINGCSISQIAIAGLVEVLPVALKKINIKL